MEYIIEFKTREQYDCAGNSEPKSIAKCFGEDVTLKEVVEWVCNSSLEI